MARVWRVGWKNFLFYACLCIPPYFPEGGHLLGWPRFACSDHSDKAFLVPFLRRMLDKPMSLQVCRRSMSPEFVDAAVYEVGLGCSLRGLAFSYTLFDR